MVVLVVVVKFVPKWWVQWILVAVPAVDPVQIGFVVVVVALAVLALLVGLSLLLLCVWREDHPQPNGCWILPSQVAASLTVSLVDSFVLLVQRLQVNAVRLLCVLVILFWQR